MKEKQRQQRSTNPQKLEHFIYHPFINQIFGFPWKRILLLLDLGNLSTNVNDIARNWEGKGKEMVPYRTGLKPSRFTRLWYGNVSEARWKKKASGLKGSKRRQTFFEYQTPEQVAPLYLLPLYQTPEQVVKVQSIICSRYRSRYRESKQTVAHSYVICAVYVIIQRQFVIPWALISMIPPICTKIHLSIRGFSGRWTVASPWSWHQNRFQRGISILSDRFSVGLEHFWLYRKKWVLRVKMWWGWFFEWSKTWVRREMM